MVNTVLTSVLPGGVFPQGLRFLIQSEKEPSLVDTRVEAFLVKMEVTFCCNVELLTKLGALNFLSWASIQFIGLKSLEYTSACFFDLWPLFKMLK